jgi:hypothetical protein
VREIWRGDLVGTQVHVRFWRYERTELPTDREELVAWLFERWQALDDWIEEQRPGVASREALLQQVS